MPWGWGSLARAPPLLGGYPHARSSKHSGILTCRSRPRSCARFSYDLTHSLQKLHSSGQRFYTSSLYKRVEKRFCWNQHLQANLRKYGEVRFTPPLPVLSAGHSRFLTVGADTTSHNWVAPYRLCHRCNDMNCR